MNRRHVPAALALALALAVALVGAGCSDDNESPVTPPAGDTRPTSPQELMFRFMAATEAMDLDAYAALVDTGFRVYLQAGTVFDYALPRDWFDQAQELAIAANLFSGQPHTPPGGTAVDGVERIAFNVLEQQSAWIPTTGTDRFQDALVATFAVDITIDQGGGNGLFVRGIIEFYVRAEAVEEDGELVDRYTLAGQVDYTDFGGKRGTEETAWGDLKAMYRD